MVPINPILQNAIGHRDYRSTSYIQVHVFQDRVEIINPGGLVSGLKLKDLGRVSHPRNLLLFSIMARMNLVEHIGSGIKRIREAMSDYRIEPPLFETDGDWFSVIFRRKRIHDTIERTKSKDAGFIPSDIEISEGLDDGKGEGIRNLLEFIEKNPGLRAPQISEALGVPVKTLERWLRILRAKDAIEFKGSRRFGGYWKK